MKYLPALCSLILLLAFGGPSVFAQSGDDLFQQALQKERSEGDLAGAISLYQKIVDNYTDVRRALVARALVQIGRSYEKLGVDLVAEARQAYEQVIRDYADQPGMVAEARGRLEALEAAVAAAAGPDEPKVLTIRKVIPRDFYGALSPDGRYFSDVNWDLGNMAVYDTKTGTYRDITDEGTWESPYQFGDASIWSPDSRQLAYYWYTGDQPELRIVNVDGSKPRILAPFSEKGTPSPRAWSTDGTFILAINEKPNHRSDQIVLVDVETGSTRTIKHLPNDLHTINLSLSPDDRYVVYETYRNGQEELRDLHILSIDSRINHPLVAHPADDENPHWTPDGRGVVFTSNRSGTPGLWYIPVVAGKGASEPRFIHTSVDRGYGFTEDGTFYYADGRSSRNVFVAEIDVERGRLQTEPKVVSQRFEGTNWTPFWSPDGSKLAYLSRREPENAVLVIRDMQREEEWDVHPKLTEMEQSLQQSWPQWSPDGTAILVKARQEEEIGLYLVDIKTERATRFTEGWNYWYNTFTPDGDDVLFVRQNQEIRQDAIVQRNIASGTERVLSDSQRYNYRLALSPDGSQLAYFGGDSQRESAGWLRNLVVMSLKDGSTQILWSATDEWWFSGEAGLEWMPDGAHLLLATYDSDKKQQQLYLVNAHSGEQKPIGEPMQGDHQIEHLDVHPNGTTIAFSRGAWMGEVWAIEHLSFGR